MPPERDDRARDDQRHRVEHRFAVTAGGQRSPLAHRAGRAAPRDDHFERRAVGAHSDSGRRAPCWTDAHVERAHLVANPRREHGGIETGSSIDRVDGEHRRMFRPSVRDRRDDERGADPALRAHARSSLYHRPRRRSRHFARHLARHWARVARTRKQAPPITSTTAPEPVPSGYASRPNGPRHAV